MLLCKNLKFKIFNSALWMLGTTVSANQANFCGEFIYCSSDVLENILVNTFKITGNRFCLDRNINKGGLRMFDFKHSVKK